MICFHSKLACQEVAGSGKERNEDTKVCLEHLKWKAMAVQYMLYYY